MIWSSCLEPVPPILNCAGGASLTALMYSCAVWYGVSALTHRLNSSSAIMATGVRSFQLNGMPVASGVVNRFDRVMISLCSSPFEFLTSRKPSPPAPPDLLITTTDCFDRLCLVMMPCMTRAIWSAPPPVPAGTMISMGLVGSHAWAGKGTANMGIETRPPTQMAARLVALVRIFLLLGTLSAADLFVGSASIHIILRYTVLGCILARLGQT